MFTITVTHIPSSTFGDDTPDELTEPRLFKCFRTRTHRGAISMYGGIPEVVLYDEYRHEAPGTWKNREAAEANVARLTQRGYTAHVTEVSS